MSAANSFEGWLISRLFQIVYLPSTNKLTVLIVQAFEDLEGTGQHVLQSQASLQDRFNVDCPVVVERHLLIKEALLTEMVVASFLAASGVPTKAGTYRATALVAKTYELSKYGSFAARSWYCAASRSWLPSTCGEEITVLSAYGIRSIHRRHVPSKTLLQSKTLPPETYFLSMTLQSTKLARADAQD